MFRALICPSSGVCDYVVGLPHWLISFLVCCVLELGCGSARVVSGVPAAGGPDTTKLTSLFKILGTRLKTDQLVLCREIIAVCS